jgi:hypothetical protein
MDQDLKGLLSSIVVRELQKLADWSKSDQLLDPAHMESLEMISKILKQNPDLAQSAAPLVIDAAGVDAAMRELEGMKTQE